MPKREPRYMPVRLSFDISARLWAVSLQGCVFWGWIRLTCPSACPVCFPEGHYPTRFHHTTRHDTQALTIAVFAALLYPRVGRSSQHTLSTPAPEYGIILPAYTPMIIYSTTRVYLYRISKNTHNCLCRTTLSARQLHSHLLYYPQNGSQNTLITIFS